MCVSEFCVRAHAVAGACKCDAQPDRDVCF